MSPGGGQGVMKRDCALMSRRILVTGWSRVMHDLNGASHLRM
jgi:hypothetical protein